MPPHYIAKGAKVQNSLVAEGCNVYGDLEFSVLFHGVYVAPNRDCDGLHRDAGRCD